MAHQRTVRFIAAALLLCATGLAMADDPLARQRGLQDYVSENTREGVLVKARFDAVTDALLKGNPTKEVIPNPVGKQMKLKSRAYLVMQLKGHDWTVVSGLGTGAIEPDKLARSIAAFMKTRTVMFIQHGHTSTSHYRLYDGPDLVESVDFTTSPDEFEKEVSGQMSDPEVKKMFDEMKAGKWLRFSSKTRKLEGEEKTNGNKFIDRALKAEGAFFPDLSTMDLSTGTPTPILGVPWDAKDIAGIAVVTGDPATPNPAPAKPR